MAGAETEGFPDSAGSNSKPPHYNALRNNAGVYQARPTGLEPATTGSTVRMSQSPEMGLSGNSTTGCDHAELSKEGVAQQIAQRAGGSSDLQAWLQACPVPLTDQQQADIRRVIYKENTPGDPKQK